MSESELIERAQEQLAALHLDSAMSSAQSNLSQSDVQQAVHECPSEASLNLSSLVAVSDGAQSERALPKEFPDLPGEIRNAIYRTICAQIGARHMGQAGSFPTFGLHDCMVSRPLAMLSVSRQVQQESYSIMPLPVNFKSRCGYGTCFGIQSDISVPDSEDEGAFLNVNFNARWDRQVEQVEKIDFILFPSNMKELNQDSINLILATLRRVFTEPADFTLLNFLVAVDRILGMGTDLYVTGANFFKYHTFEVRLSIDEGVSKVSVSSK